MEENQAPGTYECRIIDATCKHFGITKEQVSSENTGKDKQLTYCKKICAYLLRQYTPLSQQDIATRLGYRHKKTIAGFIEEVGCTIPIYRHVAHDVNKIQEAAII